MPGFGKDPIRTRVVLPPRRIHVRAGEDDVQPRRRFSSSASGRGSTVGAVARDAAVVRDANAAITHPLDRPLAPTEALVQIRVEQGVEKRNSIHAGHKYVAHHHGELLAVFQARERAWRDEQENVSRS